jgi:mannosylglycerate hydrolase
MTSPIVPTANGPRVVHIVPHTHWDREWYEPFQTFRMRLVDLLDALVPELESDPSYAHFMLDGQMAVVDDYLAVRPDAETGLRRLAESGRLSVGPWYILMDEFLVSGETIVRNLQMGLERAAAFGGAMEVGYLPDMFGHIAQMPQVLRQFGFEHAVVWRGVPAAVDRTAFWWRAPDGSTVRAEYLPQGYGNGAIVPDDPAALVQRIDDWASAFADLLDGHPVLWMNGTDHLMPQPWLGRVVEAANAIQDGYRLEVTSLANHLAAAPTDELPTWDGELRSGARANLLMGVASNRVDVKQAAARAERAVERLAEPLAALFLPRSAWPVSLLRTAWTEIVRNSAHDSICACSHDDVGRAVLHRYAEATALADGITARALAALAATVGSGPLVVNPSARTRSGLVELWWPGPVENGDGVQVLDEQPARQVRTHESLALAVMDVREMEYRPHVLGVVIEDRDGRELARVQRTPFGELVTAAVWRELVGLAAHPTDGPVTVVVSQPHRTRVLARVEELDGYGWRSWRPGPVSAQPAVATGDHSLSNGLITLEVDPADGTFAVDGHAGLGRLVDGGDVGDTYNWCPPDKDVVVDRPVSVEVRAVESGPVRGALEVGAVYRWPERAAGGERVGEREVEVLTRLELRAGERLVRVESTFDNRCRDHRLRAWFPLPEPAGGSRAECAFAVVERGLEAEGGATEAALPTFPSRRFVQAGGLTLAHEGLLEYELVDVRDGRAHALALTLLRATGLLSQGPMATRPLPAGPIIAAEAAQMQQAVTLRYAVTLGPVDPYALADDAFLPLLAVDGPVPEADTTVEGRGLAVTGAEVSALRRAPTGALELRVFNPSPETVTVTVEDRAGWLVDLRGRQLARFDRPFPLGPGRIATAVLD